MSYWQTQHTHTQTVQHHQHSFKISWLEVQRIWYVLSVTLKYCIAFFRTRSKYLNGLLLLAVWDYHPCGFDHFLRLSTKYNGQDWCCLAGSAACTAYKDRCDSEVTNSGRELTCGIGWLHCPGMSGPEFVTHSKYLLVGNQNANHANSGYQSLDCQHDCVRQTWYASW